MTNLADTHFWFLLILILTKGQFDGQASFVSTIPKLTVDALSHYKWRLCTDIIHIKLSRREKIPMHISLLSLFLLSPWRFSQDVHVGNLKVNSKYRVSVGAYGWAGEGRPSMPRDVSTASHGKSWIVGLYFILYCSFVIHSPRLLSAISDQCMPPSPPTQPTVMAVSDTELALSWQQGESEGSAPVLHFLVAYIRSVPVSSAATSSKHLLAFVFTVCQIKAVLVESE